MKRRLKELAILGLVIGTIGLLVLVSGVVPIKASGGHLTATRWLLDFASNRSIDFHSSGIETPLLDEPRLLRLGAAAYQSNCSWCHGQPGLPKPVVANQMTPSPPYLPDSVGQFSRPELFYVVKHGIKFAGMPAWPTQKRDDEIWPVVAFLKELPSISEQDYLVHVQPKMETDTDVSHLVARACVACHGAKGRGRAGPRVAIIAGQSAEYLELTLQAYRSGKRHSGIMQPIAARLQESEIQQLAGYFSKQERVADVAAAPQHDPELIALGQRLAHSGDAKEKIASCVDCHGPGRDIRSDEYPQLSGQPFWYLRKQLQLFIHQARGGTANARLMHPISGKLSEEQIEALAAFYSEANSEW